MGDDERWRLPMSGSNGADLPYPATMRAMVIDAVGPPGQLRLTKLSVPIPSNREILVRVRSAGVNTIDWKTRSGSGVRIDAFPAVLGWDLAGLVVAAGSEVTEFMPGDEVFGLVRFPDLGACYAEYVAAPVDDLCLKPHDLDDGLAAAMPMVSLTAWMALFNHLDLTADMALLVHGASGGVGHMAIQLGRWAGATVVGTASVQSHAMLHSIGLQDIASYDEIEERARSADLIIDTRGGSDLRRMVAAAHRGATVVSISGRDEEASAIAARCRVRMEFTYVHPDRAALSRIASLVASGEVRPMIQRRYPLEKIAEAHTAGEQGHVRGKLVLDLESLA